MAFNILPLELVLQVIEDTGELNRCQRVCRQFRTLSCEAANQTLGRLRNFVGEMRWNVRLASSMPYSQVSPIETIHSLFLQLIHRFITQVTPASGIFQGSESYALDGAIICLTSPLSQTDRIRAIYQKMVQEKSGRLVFPSFSQARRYFEEAFHGFNRDQKPDINEQLFRFLEEYLEYQSMATFFGSYRINISQLAFSDMKKGLSLYIQVAVNDIHDAGQIVPLEVVPENRAAWIAQKKHEMISQLLSSIVLSGSEEALISFFECFPHGDGIIYREILNKVLMGAVWRGTFLLIPLLVMHGADVNHASAQGTPLCQASNKETVHMLLLCGADVEQGYGDVTPLWHAAEQKKLENAKTLLTEGRAKMDCIAFGRQPVHVAAINGDEAMLRLFLAHGASPRAYTIEVPPQVEDTLRLSQKIFPGSTPMHLAAYFGRSCLFPILIEAGAHPDDRNLRMDNPFHTSSRSALNCVQWKEVVQDLALAGADINALNPNHQTPLFLQVLYGKAAPYYLSWMKTLGADFTIPNANGMTVCHFLATHHPIDRFFVALDSYLEQGGDINRPDDNERTILHCYVMRQSLTARFLALFFEKVISKGLDLNVVDQFDCSPLRCFLDRHIAPAKARAIIACFLQHGAKIDQRDDSGMTVRAILQVHFPDLLAGFQTRIKRMKAR